MKPHPTRSVNCDVPAVHAAITSVEDLIDLRRTLYGLAIELVGARVACPLEPDMIDSPSVRGRIGRALATGDATECAELVPISAVVSNAGQLTVGPYIVPVVSLPDSNRLLADALQSVETQIPARSSTGQSLRLLTEANGESFSDTLGLVHAGITLARCISPAMVDDLLPHVALVGVVEPGSAEPLVSASSRSFPGLLLIGRPRTAMEVAEALVHEAAHQKLFDLAITGAMLNHESDRCPPFQPTWPPAGRSWQMEQTLSAGHAYACLAQFADQAAAMSVLDDCGPDSLLPVARERAGIIGDWLLDRGDYLGADAHALLEGLHGRVPARRPVPGNRSESGAAFPRYTVEQGLMLRRCRHGAGIVIGRRSQPPELYVFKGDGALVADLLGSGSVHEVVDSLARRSAASHLDSARQVGALAAVLADLDLIRIDVH